MTSTASRELAGAARRIDLLAAERLPTQRLVERVADELRRAMPVDALVLAATDPDTLLALGAGVVHGMPAAACRPFWEYEFEVPDFNKFTDLARSPRQVADLHAATGGAFDPASTALSRCWGFLERRPRLPAEDDLARARASSGMDKVLLDEESSPTAGRRFTRA